MMNSYIYGSSRGRCLTELDCAGVNVFPGGKILNLFEMAKQRLSTVEGTKIVYFVCGIPDICMLSRSRNPKYEESYIDMEASEQSLIDNYLEKVHLIVDGLQTIGCHAIFATITTEHFEKWNDHRLSGGKTSLLKYRSLYAAMQTRLNSILTTLNQNITAINNVRGFATPQLHSYIHQRCDGRIRYKYTKLVDGVHPSNDISVKWCKHMRKIISENELRI